LEQGISALDRPEVNGQTKSSNQYPVLLIQGVKVILVLDE